MLPNVILDFHLNQSIHQLVFLMRYHSIAAKMKLHTLDVVRALYFYLDRAKPVLNIPRRFIPFAEGVRGQPVFTLQLSKWVSNWIRICYQVANETLQGLFG